MREIQIVRVVFQIKFKLLPAYCPKVIFKNGPGNRVSQFFSHKFWSKHASYYSKFKYFYSLLFCFDYASLAIEVKFYCNICNFKKTHQLKIEIAENLNGHFILVPFYGLQAADNFDLKTSLTFLISLILRSIK